MNSNEFIKKFGWEVAKRTLVNADGCDFIKIQGGYEFKFDDLKRYIDAYELIESFGGLCVCKNAIHDNAELKQAITLVEECQ